MALRSAKSCVPAVSVEDVCCALARPDLYPVRPDRVDVRETHISWMFLAGDRAYTLKKPLVLPFLDYGTPAAATRDVPRGVAPEPPRGA